MTKTRIIALEGSDERASALTDIVDGAEKYDPRDFGNWMPEIRDDIAFTFEALGGTQNPT